MASQLTATLAPDASYGPVAYRTKILYGVGGIGNALKNSLFALFTVFFYTTVKGLSGSLVGVAALIGLVADLAVDPVIGQLSDRTRSRFGRHAFMVAGSVAMGVGFWALFTPPAGMGEQGLVLWLIGTSLVARLGMAVFTIPYFALGAELSTDYRERTAISGIRGLLILASTLVAASASFVLFFPNRTPGVDPKLNVDGYSSMGVVFGLVIALTGIVSVLGTMRHRAASARPRGPGADSSVSRGAFLGVLRNRSFRLIFGSFFLFFLGVVFNSALSIHYLTYYVGISSSAALSSCQFAFYLGSAIGVAVWMRLARHADKHVLYGVAALCTSLVVLGAFVLVGDGRLLGTGGIRAMVIGHWLGGCFSSIVWFMPQSMIADASDEEELTTGHRREGSFFGLFYLGRQLAVGVSALMAGVLLDWFARFDADMIVQSRDTVWRIGLLFGVWPALCLAASGVLMLRYTLSERRVAAIRIELNGRRAIGTPR
jgi:Na+/melibiose symporter-like transporter